MMDRIEALNAVLNNPARSEGDRAVAREALERLQANNQAEQDQELERYLFGTFTSSHERRDTYDRLDASLKQLISDMNNPVFLGLYTPNVGAVERLNNLIARTNSSAIRERATEALELIAAHAEPGKRSVEAANAA